ncbi:MULTISPECIES: MarR family winged helix-turn-helix transcriptional regulator [unclassified Streptomyces]|uniref:MarR family winged helix-turn-helix transcriptional regulator n=1 Tax=unclassified Streptomyces TaxID=2593676 RepID=UPI0005A8768C|nr:MULTISPECIES: MarR family winged helix-turn-helix transcriptional regulator [unclassified Streptomyces]ODA74562.1 MarR family protein [Streptomyces sp. AVP053U2]
MSISGASEQRVAHVSSELAACLPVLHRALDRRVASGYPHPKPPEGQLALLRFVAQNEGATVREAAEALLMKPNNVSALVSQLTERGDLERRQDGVDKRIAHLHLTDVSRRRIAEVTALEESHLGRAMLSLTEGELDALGSALGALNALARQLHSAAL